MMAMILHLIEQGQHILEPGCQLKVGEFAYKVVLTFTHYAHF